MRQAVLLPLFAAVLWLGASFTQGAGDLPAFDFERGADLAAYPQLRAQRGQAQIAPGGADGKGNCLQLTNPTPAGECGLELSGPIEIRKNLTLAFDYKVEIEPGFEGAYLGMAFYVDGKQWFWAKDEFSTSWRRAAVLIPRLKGDKERPIRPGLVFSSIRLYGRVKEKDAGKRGTKARMTVWFDNLRLFVGAPSGRLSDSSRISYANPPALDWPQPGSGAKQKLQLSQDAGFPPAASQMVDVPASYYMPAAPLAPGKWFWRRWIEDELTAGWSDIQTVVIPAEAHRFTTSPAPTAQLARASRPRLRPLAEIDQPPASPEQRKLWIKEAQKIYKRGVPEHPGVHVPGDPRWPTWIDWYGKVAGGITGGTGRRLQRLGQCAMLTGDPQVTAWAAELALEACKWDPEGGSAMQRGDIGAHHLLRGLNWCYDVAYDKLTKEQRQWLREIMIARARQFAGRLMPFRGSEANNHAWLQTLALAESGVALCGEHDEAADWVEHSRQLYLGRFLSCLGYQGDNNEGLSYWGYGLGFVIEYADLMRNVCKIDLYQHPWLRQTARFPMYGAPPHAWGVSFADTGMPNHGVMGPTQTRDVRILAMRTRDPYALWYAGETKPVEGLAPRAPTDLPQSIHYRHIGVAIFNTSLVDGREGSTLALHSGQYFAGHQHPDQNSFVIHAYGEKLAIDGGYYDWYGSPHFKAYSMTTLAHNALLVDGQGQAACTPGADGRIAAWFDSPRYGYVVGDAAKPEVYGGKLKQFDRRILFIKPGFTIVHDLVQPTSPAAKLDWLLHAVRPIEVHEREAAFAVAMPRAALRGRFLEPSGVRLEVKTGFPAEPVNRYSTNPVPKEKYFPEWILHATPAQPAAQTEFVAVMQIQRLAAPADALASSVAFAAENARGVRIRCGAATHLALSRSADGAGMLSGAGLATDGQFAAVELDGAGKVVAAMVIDATSLTYNGQTLLSQRSRSDWSLPAPGASSTLTGGAP